MDVQLTPAERGPLDALAQLYTYDLSAELGLDVADDGRFAALSVDAWLADPRAHAFLIRVDGTIAGFAVVKRRSRLDGDESVADMAELFVLRRWRRRGVGGRAAASLFDRFAGRWEVREKAENQAATAFWRDVIGRYTGGRFEELLVDDERWRGPVQRFDSRAQ
jgi:predicted acetyltransferase